MAQCSYISITMTNDVEQWQGSHQGIYSYDRDINGKPSWVSSNSKRIWYDTSYNGLWKVGATDMSSFGIVAHPMGWIRSSFSVLNFGSFTVNDPLPKPLAEAIFFQPLAA